MQFGDIFHFKTVFRTSVSAKSHVEQGGKGCVSVFLAAGALPAF